MKTRNLPELLMVICDGSKYYCDRLIDIGNNRTEFLVYAKSKYIGPNNKLTRDQIVDFGNGKFCVQSDKYEDKWYSCNMKSGYCDCPNGKVCAPCKHKNSVSKLFGFADFSVVPCDDPCMQAMYHYIATGTTLEAHMYRKPGDSKTLPEVEQFIKERVTRYTDPGQTMLEMLEANFQMQENNSHDDPIEQEGDNANGDDIHQEEEHDDDEVLFIIEQFREAMEDYTNKVCLLEPNNPAILGAMKSMTKTLRKSLACMPRTIHTQMHDFGKGTPAYKATKPSSVISQTHPQFQPDWLQQGDQLHWAETHCLGLASS